MDALSYLMDEKVSYKCPDQTFVMHEIKRMKAVLLETFHYMQNEHVSLELPSLMHEGASIGGSFKHEIPH